MYQNCNCSGCWCVEINILCRSFFFVWWVILCILPFGRLWVCTWIHYRVKNRFVITLIIWKVILFEIYIYWYAGSFSRSLFAFSWNEVTRSITTPHWMGCLSIVTPHPPPSPSSSSCLPHNQLIPIYTSGCGEELWGYRVLHKNTTQWPGQGLEPRPLDPVSNALALTIRPLEGAMGGGGVGKSQIMVLTLVLIVEIPMF